MTEIEGASSEEIRLGTTPIQEKAELLEDGTLPMTIWLRGDEEFFNEFDTNAEEAMDLLGIKRSRLNQISGQELRVARARIGRYIRPIYRRSDIEEYIEWSRATVSHKKSASAIEQAVTALSEQETKLRQTLESDRTYFLKEISQKLNFQLERQTRLASNKTRLLVEDMLQQLRTQGDKIMSWTRDDFRNLEDILESLATKLDASSIDPSLLEDIYLTLQVVRTQNLEVERSQTKLSSEVSKLHADNDQLLMIVESLSEAIKGAERPFVCRRGNSVRLKSLQKQCRSSKPATSKPRSQRARLFRKNF